MFFKTEKETRCQCTLCNSHFFHQVANTHVRNIGSVGGNLMLKHAHNDFPSDVYVLLEAVGATLTTVNSANQQQTSMTPKEWLEESMDKKVLLSIDMPRHTQNMKFM